MTEPLSVVEAAAQYRASLAAREAQSLRRLARAYGDVYKRLDADMKSLLAEIADAGGNITNGQRVRMDRLSAFKKQIATEVNRYGVLADNEMTEATRDALSAAVTDSRNLTQLALPEGMQAAGIMARWHRLPTQAIESLLGFLSPEGALHQGLVSQVGPALAESVGDTLVNRVALGWNSVRIAREITREFGQALTWSMRTVRTAQNWAYREGTRASYLANADIVKGWIWSSSLDDRTCLSCLAQHGSVHPLSEALEDHFNGRCLVSGQLVQTARGLVPIESVRVGDLVRTHADRLSKVIGTSQHTHTGSVVNLSNKYGAVTVTPEHLILTQRGWIAARDVRASDTLRILYAGDVLASRRNMVHPSAFRCSSFLRSAGRFAGDRCQRGSSSTASISVGNAKSMLKDSTASCGTGSSPAPCNESRKSNSFSLQKVRQSCCRRLARAIAPLGLDADVRSASRKHGLAAICRITASCGEIGSIWHKRIRRIRDRVLMLVSAHSSRYVACSSTYRRRSQSQIGSPSCSDKSASHCAATSRPLSCGDLNSPSALALWWTALVVRPGKSAAMLAARWFQKLDLIVASSAAVHFLPMFCSFGAIGSIVHQPRTNVKWLLYDGPVHNLEVAGDNSFVAGGVVVHNCVMLPQTLSYADLGLNVEAEPLDVGDGRAWFESQSEATQRAMMGAAKWEAWRSGAFDFGDLSVARTDPVYGQMRVEASLKELMARLTIAIPQKASVIN